MDIIAKIRQKAAQVRQTIALPEGVEDRTIPAARDVIKNDFADLVLLGDEDTIVSKAENPCKRPLAGL